MSLDRYCNLVFSLDDESRTMPRLHLPTGCNMKHNDGTESKSKGSEYRSKNEKIQSLVVREPTISTDTIYQTLTWATLDLQRETSYQYRLASKYGTSDWLWDWEI